jgi:tetratricopeptide (TPR) repeat protein
MRSVMPACLLPMRRSLWIAVALLAACEPTKTETPGDPDTAALEDIETTDSPSATDPAPAAGADKGKPGKPVPKVRDRDPEEEKKKLALSHQRSAEAAKHLAAGRLVEAIDHSRQALKIHEQNVEAMLVMAEAYYGQKKFELVQAVTSSALAVDEKVRTGQESSRAHNLKGFAYVQMGNDNLATQAFRMAAEADEKNASAWNNLGTRYMQAGDVATAKGCFAYALELDPRFAKAHVNIGAAHRAEGKLVDAEKSLQAALKLRPGYAEAFFNLGLLYLDADPYPGLETIARLEKAIGFLTKYRELAIADGPDGPSGPALKGPMVAAGPAPVSQARADDYIRVAKKGIEREQRRIDREKGRDKPTDKPTKPGDAGKPDPAAAKKPGGEPTDAAPQDAAPDAGETPTKVDPSKPATPQKPGAAKPTAPSTASPTTPTTTPSPTTPAKPTPAKPTPAKPASPSTPPPATPPAAKPTSPPASPPPAAPVTKPTTPPAAKPTTPPASPPPAAKPTTPAAPQKPAVQKPGASPKSAARAQCDRASAPPTHRVADDPSRAAWNPRRCVDTHALARAHVMPVGHALITLRGLS